MKIAIFIIGFILCIELGFGFYYQHCDSENILAAMGAVRSAPIKWEYKVVACDDDNKEMEEYAKTHPESSGLDYSGQFDLLNVRPDGKDSDESEWDLCAWFLEPKTNPKLILIFKRQVQ
jgi:hypothetical protein